MSAPLRMVAALPPPRRSNGDVLPLSLVVEFGSLVAVETPPALAGAVPRMACGLLGLAAGRVELFGRDVGSASRDGLRALRARTGVALHPHGLLSNQTLRMNLVVPLVYAGLAGMAEGLARADRLLAACGVGEWAADRPADVPPAVQQTASLARALVRGPELLLLQDAFAGLRGDRAEELLALCRREAATILLAEPGPSHVPADAVVRWENRTERGARDEVGAG